MCFKLIQMKKAITYREIGVIRTPFVKSKGMPIQAQFSNEKGKIILSKKYQEALKGLEGFSHIILLYHFHKTKESKLIVKPFLSEEKQGIFAVRAPNRPNSIGFSIVELLEIIEKENEIEILINKVDMLDNTPLLDIKPYMKEFDSFPNAKCGWYDNRSIKHTQADDRFSKQ